MLDREQIIPKIKKYVLYVSVAFFFVSLFHLVYLYLYNDAKTLALKWWTLSEGIIGDYPHLNPLVSSTGNEKYIIHALYRSLLKYDSTKKKFIGDLTTCDIKNLQLVECFLNENTKWSDGTDVSTKDIVSTFSLIKKTGSNPVIASLLSNTDIEDNGTSVIFKTDKSDINFLNIFLQPIISQKVIDTLSESQITGKFPVEGMLYSWPYMVESFGQDENIGIKKVTLTKNPQYSDKEYSIDKIILKIFNDIPELLKHKDSVNIYNDKGSVIGDSLPRLSVFDYTLPQYISVFINTERVQNLSLRKYILGAIKRENILQILGTQNFQEVKNPYLTDISIDSDFDEGTVETLLKKNGYYKKEELAKVLLGEVKETLSEVIQPKPAIDINATTKIIYEPTTQKYNFVSKDDILLKGKVESAQNVKNIYINDYQLKGFRTGDSEFAYRLKEAGYDTIKQGVNDYKVSFEYTDGKKEIVDEVVYYYNTDSGALEQEKQKLTIPQPQANTWQTLTTTQDTQKQEIIDKIDALDGKFLYNRDLEKLSFTLLYANSDKYIDDTAKSIQAQLEKVGISTTLQEVDVIQLNKNLLSGKKDYDLILVGVNLWYFDNNIFPYFHSSQVKNGYNFSNYKKLGLDILLEDLKSSSLTQSKIDESEAKVLDIIKGEAIVKTLYTPIMKELVDKNVKNFIIPDSLPDDTLRLDGLKNAYILQKKIVNYSNKSFSWFFSYIWNSLF